MTQPTPTTPPVRVVIADDAEQLRGMLARGLERHGTIEVVGQAGDGQAALAEVAVSNPDVLLLDLSMPLLDGLEVLRRVHDRHPDVAVLVFSGYGNAQLAATCTELGAAGYLEKGVALDAVRSAVIEAARGSR